MRTVPSAGSSTERWRSHNEVQPTSASKRSIGVSPYWNKSFRPQQARLNFDPSSYIIATRRLLRIPSCRTSCAVSRCDQRCYVHTNATKASVILPFCACRYDVATMEHLPGFDTSTMTYLATQMAHPNVNGNADPFQDMLLPLEMHDHQSTYGYAGYGFAVDHLNVHRMLTMRI